MSEPRAAQRDPEETIEEVCSIVSMAYAAMGDYTLSSDGFCRKCPARISKGWSYVNSGVAVDYVREAVVEKLARDGYAIPEGYDANGREVKP